MHLLATGTSPYVVVTDNGINRVVNTENSHRDIPHVSCII